MLIRFALESEEDAVVGLARAATAESFPHLTFSEARCRETFQSYLREANPVFFVAENERQLVGFQLMTWLPFAFAEGSAAEQWVIYVQPAHRGSCAGAELVKNSMQWARTIGASEMSVYVASGSRYELTERYMTRFGFEVIGGVLRRKDLAA